MLAAGRLTATTITAAERTGILDKALQLQERRVSVETRTIAHVLNETVAPLMEWLNRGGLTSPEQLMAAARTEGDLNHSTTYFEMRSEFHNLKRWLAGMLRAVVNGLHSDATDEEKERPGFPSNLDSYVLISCAELAALRAAAVLAGLPELAARPATDPDIARLRRTLSHPGPPDPPSTNGHDRRPPGVGVGSWWRAVDAGVDQPVEDQEHADRGMPAHDISLPRRGPGETGCRPARQ
jgi:hypothetical protein